MPTTASIGSTIRRPFTANKRLFTMLTVAFVVIGLFFAVYYSHIQTNENHFRQSKLRSLDSNFDIITKQLNNDFQKYYSTSTIDSLAQNENGIVAPTSKIDDDDAENDAISTLLKVRDSLRNIKRDSIRNAIRDSIWQDLENKDEAPLFEQEFDEFIVVFKNIAHIKESKADSVLELSSLKGRIVLPDSLEKQNPFNIGWSIGIPEKDKKYQLFGREYKYTTDLDEEVKYHITIFGLVEAERYNEAVRKLDPWIIALLTTFLLLSLFGMPYFKLLFIAEDERLKSNDVILSGISIVVGAPIIMIVFLSLVNHYHDYYHKVPNQLNELGIKVKHRFEEENLATVTELYKIPLNERFASITDSLPGFDSLTTGHFKEYLKGVSKIGEEGTVYHHTALINKKFTKKTKNLGKRPYFEAFRDSSNLWYAPIDNKDIIYAMRPVVSIEDGTEEAVYILENEGDAVSIDNNTIQKVYRVGAAQLKSVHDPIVPFGFEFAIIDESGEVWFHSEKRKATLENFFAVSRNTDQLKAAVVGRINAKGLINYRDDGKLFNVIPINNSNLSVITLYDIGLLRTRVSQVLILSCVVLIMAFVLILIITVLSLIIRNPKFGLYKYDRFLFEFLTPKEDNEVSYIMLSLLFIGLVPIGAITGTCLALKPVNIYLLCLLLSIFSYLIVFYTLHPHRNKRHIKFRVRDGLLLLAICFLNVIMFKVNEDIWGSLTALFIQMVCIFILFYYQLSDKAKRRFSFKKRLRSFVERIRKSCKRISDDLQIGYRYWYAIFLFSWLLLATILPSCLIFQNAKLLNDRIWLKTDLIYKAKKFMDKERRLKDNLTAFKSKKPEFATLYEKHLQGGQYPDSLEIRAESNTVLYTDESKTPFSDEFLWNARPFYDNRIREFQALVYPSADDNSWTGTKESDKLALSYLDKRGSVTLNRSDNEIIQKGNDGFWALGITGFVLLLAILFSLILFFTDRIFAFRFMLLKPSDFDKNKEEDYIRKFGNLIDDDRSNSGLLLIGPPCTGKRTFANEVLKTAGYTKAATLSMLQLENVVTNTDILDILNVLAGFSPKVPDAFQWDDHEAFIIEHLEHNIKSYAANHIKLMVILFLISKKKRIILVSEIYPSQIFAMYENTPEESNLPWGSLEDDFNSWRNILGAFPQVLIGITENQAKVYRRLFVNPKETSRLHESLKPLIEELGHSKFLPTLAPILVKKTYDHENETKKRLDQQRMVMHTQNLAHGYYNDIWNTLPTRERYLLYDLAKDSFLNIKNRNSLFSLMKKGLIVWSDRPAIFNYSFKNFIMTSVSLNEALRLEHKNRGKGTWANTRILLYLIIATAIVFIVLGKPELIKDFEALIGTLGGLGVVIPLVSKLLASRQKL